VHNEYCETPEDFIARRTRLAFLDRLACEQALPRVGGTPVASGCGQLAAGSSLACQGTACPFAQFWCLLRFLCPQVVELMASEKGWSRSRARSELQRALDFLKTFEAPPAPAAAAAAAASA
jgi:glycerol-3-phosphate dehydrogenase